MIHKPSSSLPLIILHLSLAILALLLFMASVATAGIEIVRIYLQTSWYLYPVMFFSLCGFFFVLNIILAGLAAFAIAKKRSIMSRRSDVAITLALAVICLYLADPYLRMFHPPVEPGAASARERLWTRIGPVVQFGPFIDRRADTSSSMVIWFYDPARKGEAPMLRFGTDALPGNMKPVMEAAGDGRRHEFHLTGLSPATRYYYQIPSWGTAVRSFRTGPEHEPGAQIRFMAVGDTDSSRKGGYAYSYLRNVLRAAMTAYRERGQRPDFLVHAGDMVRTGADLDAWHNFFSTIDMIDEIPIAVAPGNHEFLLDGGANFRYLFGQPDYYALDHGCARIFFINSFDGPGKTLDGPVITTGKDQYRWIRRELAHSSEAKWLIVVIHTPILSTGDYGVNELLAAQYFELFKKHGVDLVISGHDHNFDSFYVHDATGRDGTIYIVSGTGGSALDSYIMDRPSHRWLDWRHDGNSPLGLYQHDRYTAAYHNYGELSWGFTGVEAGGNAMSVSYYRWLDFDMFLRITGQSRNSWDMTYMNDNELAEHNLLRAVPVKQIDRMK